MVIFVKAGGLSAYHTSHCVALTDDDMLCGREGGGCYLPQSTPFFSLVDSELLREGGGRYLPQSTPFFP